MNTREKILKSAWELFSEKGFEDVSVRDITNHAGVNLASVSYHFKGKNGVIQEIIKKALVPLNRHRVVLLKQAGEEAGGLDKITIQSVIMAFVRPVVCPQEHGGNPELIKRLIARYLIDREYSVPDSVMASFSDVYKIFGKAVLSVYPEMSEEKALEKLVFSSGTVFMYQTFSSLASKALNDGNILNIETYLDDAVEFCAAGFEGGGSH